MSDALSELQGELRMLCAQGVVISTNVELRLDGLPYANQRPPEDPRGCHRVEEVRVATRLELSNGSKVSGFAAPNSISIVCDYMGKRTQIAWSNEAAIAVATIILGLHGKMAGGEATPTNSTESKP